MQPRYLLAAILLIVLTFAPLTIWPGGSGSAHAQSLADGGSFALKARPDWLPRLLTIVASNENEQKDKDDRRDHGNNANNNGNGNGNNNNNSNNNDNDGGGMPPPPPPVQRAPAPAPDMASACLSSGGSVSLSLDNGTVTLKVFQDNLNVELARVDSGSPACPARATWAWRTAIGLASPATRAASR